MRNQTRRQPIPKLVLVPCLAAILGLGVSTPADAKCPCEIRMAATLEQSFGVYQDSSSEMEFNFDVEKESRHVDVGLLGQDFDASDQDWTGKDEASFSAFLTAIGDTVSEELKKPMVRLHVIGKDGAKLLVFRYE